MDAVAFCRSQCETLEKQLEIVMAGMAEETLDHKLHSDGLSPRELYAHLGECLAALRCELQGTKHEWGSYSMKATSVAGQKSEYHDLRRSVLGEAFADGSDRAIELVSGYVVLHDAYHVGQAAAIRAGAEGWDTGLIYS